MNKTEVVELMERIDHMYPGKFNTRNMASTIPLWQEALKDFDKELAHKNLDLHVLTNDWPPQLANLTRRDKETRTTVRSFEETRSYLARYEQPVEVDAEEVEKQKAAIRKILGLDGAEQ